MGSYLLKELTKVQKEMLEYLIHIISKGKLMPTLAELADHFGYKNRATVQQHLLALEKKGYLRRNPKISRGIELVTDDDLFITKPVLGEVAAGNPITIYPDTIDTVELPKFARVPADSFLVKVKGDSLKDAYIFSGDVLIVNPNIESKNGHFVVAVLDEAAVVKRIFIKEKNIELHSENPEFDPIIIDSKYSNFRVIGVVVGIYRSMDKK